MICGLMHLCGLNVSLHLCGLNVSLHLCGLNVSLHLCGLRVSATWHESPGVTRVTNSVTQGHSVLPVPMNEEGEGSLVVMRLGGPLRIWFVIVIASITAAPAVAPLYDE
jgi:hypothetical protein